MSLFQSKRIFLTIDLICTYHQMNPEYTPQTNNYAIWLIQDPFHVVRSLKCLSNLQHFMDEVLRGLDFCLIYNDYNDNILLYSDSNVI